MATNVINQQRNTRRRDNREPKAQAPLSWKKRALLALCLSAQATLTAQSVPPNDLDLLGVWGTAANDVWAAGETRKEDQSIGLYHFDGEAWTPGAISDALREQLFPDAPSDQLVFRSIAGNASNNLYAVATRFDDDGRFVVRFDGTQWDIHGFISSEKFVASYVSPETGAVYIGGRGFGGGNSIVRRALARLSQLEAFSNRKLLIHSEGAAKVSPTARSSGAWR